MGSKKKRQVSTGAREDMQALGAAIRKLRVRGGLTQAAVAADASLSAKYVGELDRGSANPTFGVLVEVAYVLGVSPSALLKAAGF